MIISETLWTGLVPSVSTEESVFCRQMSKAEHYSADRCTVAHEHTSDKGRRVPADSLPSGTMYMRQIPNRARPPFPLVFDAAVDTSPSSCGGELMGLLGVRAHHSPSRLLLLFDGHRRMACIVLTLRACAPSVGPLGSQWRLSDMTITMTMPLPCSTSLRWAVPECPRPHQRSLSKSHQHHNP